jgi:hypothetical protein
MNFTNRQPPSSTSNQEAAEQNAPGANVPDQTSNDTTGEDVDPAEALGGDTQTYKQTFK